jgi:predicted esterase
MIETRSVSVRQTLRYRLSRPETPGADLFVVSLHGYGQAPDLMVEYTRKLLGPAVWIAAPYAPNEFSLTPFKAFSEIGYNWGTVENWSAAIERHHEILLALLDDLRGAAGARPERTLLMGFSQPVGLNYRFAGTHPSAVRAVLGICGGVPKDWETLPLAPIPASLMHIAREEDEFYPREHVAQFESRLRIRASDVEYRLIAGKHRLPRALGPVIAPWVARVFGLAIPPLE